MKISNRNWTSEDKSKSADAWLFQILWFSSQFLPKYSNLMNPQGLFLLIIITPHSQSHWITISSTSNKAPSSTQNPLPNNRDIISFRFNHSLIQPSPLLPSSTISITPLDSLDPQPLLCNNSLKKTPVGPWPRVSLPKMHSSKTLNPLPSPSREKRIYSRLTVRGEGEEEPS